MPDPAVGTPSGFLPPGIAVLPGDTIFTVAARAGVVPEALYDANPGVDPYRLWVGQCLVLPMRLPPPGPRVPLPPVSVPLPVSREEPPHKEPLVPATAGDSAAAAPHQTEETSPSETAVAHKDALRRFGFDAAIALRDVQTSLPGDTPVRERAERHLLRAVSRFAALLRPSVPAAAELTEPVRAFLSLLLTPGRTAGEPGGLRRSEQLRRSAENLAQRIRAAVPGSDSAVLYGILMSLAALAQALPAARSAGLLAQEAVLTEQLFRQALALADAAAPALAAVSGSGKIAGSGDNPPPGGKNKR